MDKDDIGAICIAILIFGCTICGICCRLRCLRQRQDDASERLLISPLQIV